jgi:site-specific DNA recombinase
MHCVEINIKGIRYRYDISESLKHKTRAEAPDGWRVPGGHLEKIVKQGVTSVLADESALFATMKQSGIESHIIPKLLIALKQVNRDNVDLLDLLLHRVMLQHQVMTISLNLNVLLKSASKSARPLQTSASSHATEACLLLTYDVPLCIKRRGVEMRLVLNNTAAPQSHDTTLITAIARAYHWLTLLTSGQVTTIAQIATSYGVDRSYASRILSLAFLAPDIIERILTGNYPAEITVELLTKKLVMPTDWQQQRELLNMA